MRERDAWSQDQVLNAMCERVKELCAENVSVDFALVTGDIAFSGKPDEYNLARDFFNALSQAAKIQKKRIYCVPGNHDIDRSRQESCFEDVRSKLDSQQLVDEMLEPDDNLHELLKREENYRRFQDEYFENQERKSTSDGLAYVSHLKIGDIILAIVGLDSAWLAKGGPEDHCNLLIGERQAINAMNLAQDVDDPPHVVITMAHHPCHLLQEFDRRVVQKRIERTSQFFHYGHLHHPEARAVVHGSDTCFTLSAGPAFEARESTNSFSVIKMDILDAKCRVTTMYSDSIRGAFSAEAFDDFEIKIIPKGMPDVDELAREIYAHWGDLFQYAYYLAALLLDLKAEFLIPAQNGYTFGALASMKTSRKCPIEEGALKFMSFQNVLRALYGRIPLQKILTRYGEMVSSYGLRLHELCKEDNALKRQLAGKEIEAKSLSDVGPEEIFAHRVKLLENVAETRDWPELCGCALRFVASPDTRLAIHARRMLALGFAHGSETEKKRAISIYQTLSDQPHALAADLGNLAGLLLECDDPDGAKGVVTRGFACFPGQVDYFRGLGHRIAGATGDENFRSLMLEEARKALENGGET